MEEIRTVKREASDELTEKKSVFIGYCAPVKTESEARDFIAKIKKKHSDARHTVSAYVLRGGIMHSSDDGEPSGTAGVPVLEVIRKNKVEDTVVVVTRYFGGILLGAGGLVRAYSAAAKLAIDAAEIVTYVEFCDCEMVCSYGDYNDVLYRLGQFTVNMGESEFAENVRLRFSVLAEEKDALFGEIDTRFNGIYQANVVGKSFDVKR